MQRGIGHDLHCEALVTCPGRQCLFQLVTARTPAEYGHDSESARRTRPGPGGWASMSSSEVLTGRLNAADQILSVGVTFVGHPADARAGSESESP